MKRSSRKIWGLATITLMLFGVLALSGCASNSAKAGTTPTTAGTTSSNQSQQTPQRETQSVQQGGSLTIALKDLTDKAQFYPITLNGARMEVLAFKDKTGKVHTAFNTCQVCYSSGKGYYVQEGDYLVCQNCGNKFGVDQVEIKTGGCNPLPIFENEKKTTDSEISVPYETLKKSESFFVNWKK